MSLRLQTLTAVALCACALSACGGPESAAERDESTAQPLNGCGVERWAVKTGTDAQASMVSLSPVDTTIAHLREFPGTANPPYNARIPPAERTTWKLTDVTLVVYKPESDGDIHLVLSQGGVTMIAELADPGCVDPSSPFAAAITKARAQFAAAYPQPAYTVVNRTVTLAGVGFFDFLHGQTGVAPNGVELHPVLSICFDAGCTLPAIASGGGALDGGASDGGAADAGSADAGASDAGSLDAGTPDAGAPPPQSGPPHGCSTAGALPLWLALAALSTLRLRRR